MRFTFDKSKPIIISLGGSIFYPAAGLDVDFLKQFTAEIKTYVAGGYRFILITGGGAICRTYQQAAMQIGTPTDADLDWIGIASTRLNAQLVRTALNSIAHEVIIEDPTHPPKSDPAVMVSGGSSLEPILVGGGWKPGCSTDHDAVLLAIEYGAAAIINLSTADFVYTADPKKDSNAKKLLDLSWDDYMKIIPNDWKPGMNAPFDPTASKLAAEKSLNVFMANGRDLANLRNLIEGKEASGTTIHP